MKDTSSRCEGYWPLSTICYLSLEWRLSTRLSIRPLRLYPDPSTILKIESRGRKCPNSPLPFSTSQNSTLENFPPCPVIYVSSQPFPPSQNPITYETPHNWHMRNLLRLDNAHLLFFSGLPRYLTTYPSESSPPWRF